MLNVAVRLEGFLKYILSNSIPFTDHNDAKKIVREEVKRKWSSNFSRHLIPALGLRPEKPAVYSDHTGIYLHYWQGIRIRNARLKQSAINVVAVLNKLTINGREVSYNQKVCKLPR